MNLDLVQKTAEIVREDGFRNLRGADLIFACIAHIEDAYLVTMDNHFDRVSEKIRVLNLNGSKNEANYRDLLL